MMGELGYVKGVELQNGHDDETSDGDVEGLSKTWSGYTSVVIPK